MEQPKYVRRLLNQKWLLIVGAVVSVVAGLLAGFTIDDGQIQPRSEQTFQASATIMLTSPDERIFQTEIPGTTQALPTTEDPSQQLITTEATPLNLTDSAILLAYMASSDEVRDAVETSIGGLEDGDAITAVRRTTQPAGDEQFGGRLALPIIDIVGVSTSADRAELLASAATTAFGELVLAQQTERGIPEDIRLVLDEINAPVAGEGEGSNPAIPVIVTAVGVFLLFIALALIIEAVRDRRRRRDEMNDDADVDDDEDDTPDAAGPVRRSGELPADDRLDTTPGSTPGTTRSGRRRRSTDPVEPEVTSVFRRDAEPAEPARR